MQNGFSLLFFKPWEVKKKLSMAIPVCMCSRKITVSLSKRKSIVSTKSADLSFSLLSETKDQLFLLKLPAKLDVMLRFLHYFKCEQLSQQKSVSWKCDIIALLWKEVVNKFTKVQQKHLLCEHE